MALRDSIRIRSKTTTSLVFFVFLLLLIGTIKTPFNYYDEGFAVFNAVRVLDGDVPYRDFWAIYPPGQFYGLAAAFRIFGASLLVSRTIDIIVRFIIVICVYIISIRITTWLWALLTCVITTILLATSLFYSYAVFPALALGLLATLSVLKYVDDRRFRWLVLAGCLIGTTVLFRWDVGLYTGISVVMTVVVFHFHSSTQNTNEHAKVWTTTTRSLLILMVTIALVVLPIYGYVSWKSGFGNLWAQMFVFPATALHDLRSKSYPPLVPSVFPITYSLSSLKRVNADLVEWLQFYLPLVIFGIALLYYIRSTFKRSTSIDTSYVIIATLVTLGVLLFAQALSRNDYIHRVPTSIIAFLVAAVLISRFAQSIPNSIIKYSFLLLMVFPLLLYFRSPVMSYFSWIHDFPPMSCNATLERAGCIPVGTDQEQAVEYIQTHTMQREPIFVGNQRHDLISINNIGFYFLVDRTSATRYHELYPGVATTIAVQDMIINEIESKAVNWIVLMDAPVFTEPNDSTISSGVYLLDDFLHSRFTSVAKFGSYDILERMDTAAPR